MLFQTRFICGGLLKIKNWVLERLEGIQGLIHTEKVYIYCEKVAQISILANKIATQLWLNIIIKESKQIIYYNYFFILRC